MVNRGINLPPSPTQILDIICDSKLAAWDLTPNQYVIGAEAALPSCLTRAGYGLSAGPDVE